MLRIVSLVLALSVVSASAVLADGAGYDTRSHGHVMACRQNDGSRPPVFYKWQHRYWEGDYKFQGVAIKASERWSLNSGGKYIVGDNAVSCTEYTHIVDFELLRVKTDPQRNWRSCKIFDNKHRPNPR